MPVNQWNPSTKIAQKSTLAMIDFSAGFHTFNYIDNYLSSWHISLAIAVNRFGKFNAKSTRCSINGETISLTNTFAHWPCVITLEGGNMAANQDSDDDMEDITDEMEEGGNIENLLKTMNVVNKAKVISNLTARRRIEDLLEERRLHEQIEDFTDRDWD